MKVVQINAVYEFSSTGRTTMEMHQSLKAQGIDSIVFSAKNHIPNEQVYMIGNKLDHKIHALGSRIFGRQGYFSYISTKKLLSHIDRIGPDIVILRNLHGNFINIPLLLRFLGKKNIATIVVLHDCWFFTGHCCHYTEDKCFKWEVGCHHCPILHTYNKSLFFDNCRSIFNMKKVLFNNIPRLAVVGVSDWITTEGMKSPIFKNAKIIRRLYNWIDLGKFYPRTSNRIREELGLETKDFVALGVAQQWTDRKGLKNIIQAAKRLPNMKFVLVGNKPNIQAPSNIIFPGVCSSVDRLAEYYSMADVFINFSIQETFGKAAAESLSCGTPLIVNNATANPELCGNGCGYVIDSNHESDIINALHSAASMKSKEYNKDCRQFAENTFDKEKIIKQYLSLFEELKL